MTTQSVNNDVVTGEVLAELFGITPRAVRVLAEKRIIERAAPNLFPLADSVRLYIADLRDKAAGRGGNTGLAAERERETRARADIMELKAAAARREFIPAGEVEAAWSDILRLVRARLLAMPGRLQLKLPHLSVHDVAAIDREIRASLTEVSDDSL